MPPASRGCFNHNSFRHVSRLYTFRRHQCQRRLSTKPPPKPTLPPRTFVQAAAAQRLREAELAETIATAQRLRAKIAEIGGKRRRYFSPAIQRQLQRISLPAPIRRFLARFSVPPRVRGWIWKLLFFGPPIAVVFMSFPLALMKVEGQSMVPLLNANASSDVPAPPADRLIVRKIHVPATLANLFGPPNLTLERGQVVVFHTPHKPDGLAVKRVIALPGDRVQPLSGYPGGDDKPVIIPYNHIWVEGDANSRNKSVDSNHFGPISQNMLYGFVLASYTPWKWFFGWPQRLESEGHNYPAKDSGRVEKDVVKHARLDADQQERLNQSPFRNGTAALELAMMRRNRFHMPRRMRDPSLFAQYRNMYALAQVEVQKGNASSREVAEGLINELEVAFESVGLNKDGSRLTSPAKAERLQEYLAKHGVVDGSLSNDSAASTE